MTPTDPALVKARQRVAEIEQEGLVAWKKRSGVTPEVLDLYRHYEALASDAKKAAAGALMKIEHLVADDTIPIESRRRQAREAYAAANAKVKKCQAAMETTLQVIDSHLQLAALPRLADRSREALVRDEIRTRIMGSADPVGALFEIAQQDDELAAVVTQGTFAESLLRGQRVSVREAKETARILGNIAAEAAANSADPARRAAAEAREALATDISGGVATFAVTRQTLEDAVNAAQPLEVAGLTADVQPNGNGDG
jgi:hypothetical protein